MIRIAVTGGIACGKSLAASFLKEAAVSVCEADTVAHLLMEPGSVVYRQVLAVFGSGILATNGFIDRQILGNIVFNDEVKRAQLNAVVHPAVGESIEKWLARQEAEGAKVAAVVIPLLFEANMASGWDAIICVASSLPVQMARLRARGLGEAECKARLLAQMPLEEKTKKSDFTIWNDDSPEELSASVMRTLKVIEEKYA